MILYENDPIGLLVMACNLEPLVMMQQPIRRNHLEKHHYNHAKNVKREQVQTPICWVCYTTFCVGTTRFLFHFPWPPVVVNHDIFMVFVQVVHRCRPFEDLES